MKNYLDSLLGIDLPLWIYIVAPLAFVFLILFIIWFINTRIFKSRLKKLINTQDGTETSDAIKEFQKYYPANKLMRYSKRMERYSRKMGSLVVRKTGLADKWVQKLLSSKIPASKDLKRVLLYCPQSNLFKAFISTGKSQRLQNVFNTWMKQEGEEKVIRLLAETCRGEKFEPALGINFFNDNTGLLRELTGDPEWFSRYFAYQILLCKMQMKQGEAQGDASIESGIIPERMMEDGLKDSHPLIRRILTENVQLEKEKTWRILWDKLTCDPVYEVREAARKRITDDYADTYNPKNEMLNEIETSRVLELLDPGCQADRAFAMSSLELEDKSLRYPAAVFLQKCGILDSMLSKNTMDDPVSIENSISVLKKAMEVNVSGFLSDYFTGDGAPLLIASRLLAGASLENSQKTGTGTQEHICYLEKKVFAFFSARKPDPVLKEIYLKTLEAVYTGGNVKSYEILLEELSQRENDKAYLEMLLKKIPADDQALFTPVLFGFLENTGFPLRDELINLLGTFSADIILAKIFNILNAQRASYPHIVRISALKILGRLGLPFCLQRILESLPVLKTEELEEFAKIIAGYPQEIFEEKARSLLASPDARIRSCIIAILPDIKNESFMKEIRASLKDADPDVRVAAIRALLGFGEIKLLNQETSMLHDPVERVRLATAEVIAVHGNAQALEILKNVIEDPNETDTVKTGVIGGLAQAAGAEGIPILVSVLDSNDSLREHAEKALAMRVTRKDITRIIDIFKDAEPALRDKLIPVFRAQGRKAEPQIVEILKDEVASVKPYLVKILEETGFIDETVRRLSNRSADTRREAAFLLSFMDTLPAFRGLVLAAKDPDQEVRVCVVKALEKLKSGHSREILEKLKEDPDSRIRKYTYWALERLDSLAME
ncbi:MAG: HEAT repeat domain-containing protein [Treponema sp.]|nr:HEAT repeat domain-containing protein [Treponema sp.]